MNISVIIPVYNAAAYIEKAVTSALFHNEVKEVVVVNDGSTDNSLAILQKLQQTDNRIKIYHHENNSNKGRSASRNLALQKATQHFIAFLDVFPIAKGHTLIVPKKEIDYLLLMSLKALQSILSENGITHLTATLCT
mgnify:CR=1 FL=1